MKAVILAAGKGERLGKVTEIIPKPMIKVHGKPILEYNIDLCRKFGLTDIFINVHHLGSQITEYFGDGNNFGVNISYLVENKLHGTSGAVKKIAEKYWDLDKNNTNDKTKFDAFCSQIEPFFVLYGDNLSNYNLLNIQEKAISVNSIVTIGFHYREDVSSSGVAEIDTDGRILSFMEKPKANEIKSHWVNAGIYYLTPEVFKYIPEENSDFSRNIFPLLLADNIPIYGVKEDSDVKAFDTIEMLNKNIQ